MYDRFSGTSVPRSFKTAKNAKQCILEIAKTNDYSQYFQADNSPLFALPSIPQHTRAKASTTKRQSA